ncbi:MAG TPA: hypothetical protein VGH89_38300 [Pseudonocardia sp.]|jgi:hypothetical protein
METTLSTQLSNRDRAVLRAVAQGRCTIAGGCGTSLMIDGLCCSDQFAGVRLANAGLITVIRPTGRVELAPQGAVLVQAA